MPWEQAWDSLFAVISTSEAATIFSQNFGGGSGALNGTAPTTTTGGATWVAGAAYNVNGSVAGAGAGDSATLSFVPADGLIYVLDASFGATTYGSPPDNDWFAIGFANGQTSSTGSGSRFINGSVIGSPWMLQRGPGGGVGQTFLGNATSGTQNGEPWTAKTGLSGGSADLRIVLDTTGGAGNWTATFFARPTGAPTFSEVRATQTLVSENINSVGIARSSGDISGTITSFSLTTIPEPSSLLLLGFGAATALRRRR